MNAKQEAYSAYPLQWPIGWQRATKRTQSMYKESRSIAAARDELTEQLRLLGARAVVVSSNVPLRSDGVMRSIAGAQPDDTGVAVYFTVDGKNLALAADKFTTVQANLWAIAVTIDSLRRIARAGVSELLDRAYSGFPALPAGTASTIESDFATLGAEQWASEEAVADAYKAARRRAHPDAGGTHEAFIHVQEAYRRICEFRGWQL